MTFLIISGKNLSVLGCWRTCTAAVSNPFIMSLQQQLSSQCDEDALSVQGSCPMLQEKESLREEWKVLEEQRKIFERERRNFTEAAIRLSDEVIFLSVQLEVNGDLVGADVDLISLSEEVFRGESSNVAQTPVFKLVALFWFGEASNDEV